MSEILHYLYVASSALYRSENVWKLGCTREPRGRLSTYLTGCPPGLTPNADIGYHALFLTNAPDREELELHETELFNAFPSDYRLMRAVPNDTEWFRFPASVDALAAIATFVEKQSWFVRKVDPKEIPARRRSRLMARNYHQNTKCLRVAIIRNQRLTELQEPEIEKLKQFLLDPGQRAGYFVAPCGIGKTRMACRAIERAKLARCVVVAPTIVVERQWAEEIKDVFAPEAVRFSVPELRGDEKATRDFLSRERFCLIINRSSTDKLLPFVERKEDLGLLVLDECHHFAGELPKENGDNVLAEGVGKTRAFILQAQKLGIKQLGLTYTPRTPRTTRGESVVTKACGYRASALMEPQKSFWLCRDD